jgi:hypothetical protein
VAEPDPLAAFVAGLSAEQKTALLKALTAPHSVDDGDV